MSHATNTASNTHTVHDGCIMCLGSFGIQEMRLPRKCNNKKCARYICGDCVRITQVTNGDNRPFRCMYCLEVYKKNQLPEKDLLVEKQLWQELIINYGIKRTRQVLSRTCDADDLISDMDCRRRHLMNLISLWRRYFDAKSSDRMIMDAENLVKQLSQTIQNVKDNRAGNLNTYRDAYRFYISKSCTDGEIGLFYIRLCEDLQCKIWNADCQSMFPNTDRELQQWMHQQGPGDQFEPKIPVLFRAMEKDLISQYSNPYRTPRVKIGVIGYTSAGKSSLINRLLGVKCLEEVGAASVSTNKSTYFLLQYDRKIPLMDPDNRKREILVSLVDILGLDNNRISPNIKVEAGNYVDEIHKADCDIYIVVFDDEFSEQQQEWVNYIEQVLERKCVLVRSKVDCLYLELFHKYSGKFYACSDSEQRAHFHPIIIKKLKDDMSSESRNVHLVACYYVAPNSDAHKLQELNEQLFDFPLLLETLGRLASDAQIHRIHAFAKRLIARAINTSFRRGYVLNVMKYKVAAGFASILPFGDQLPRYLSRDSIRDAFGIDDTFHQYLTEFHLIVYNYALQTSVFEKCVEIRESQMKSKLDAKWVGKTAGTALVVGGNFTDDILRVAAPAATALTGAARVAFTVATIGIGVIISAAVSAWSAVDSGKHIFSYTNRICDDIVMMADPFLMTIIERERKKVSDRTNSIIN